ncbi:MAG: hypothetical protein C4519_11625 [Desulfobacteraceae bacterium]|nr:MAG: hypothetical protein C4519_11625 [Desulfobacteraceae bacterium]
MKRTIVLLLAFTFWHLAGIAAPADAYEDLRGRFVIDLPEGWQLQPQTDDRVYVFKKDGDSIILEYVLHTSDPGELLKKALATLGLSGLKKPVLEGDLESLSINGHPARWGMYKSEMAVGGTQVTLFSRLGCVSLDEHGVYFMSIFNQTRKAELSRPLAKAFQSIRAPGQALTGASAVRSVPAETAAPAPTAWQHEFVRLNLPPGWKEKPKLQNFEEEVIGWFEYEPLGAHLLALCYRGFGMNKTKALKAAKQTVEISMPNAAPAKVYELELESGDKAPVVVYRGTSVSRGAEVQSAAATATLKAGKCYLDLIGYVQAAGLDELERDIVAIARSAE